MKLELAFNDTVMVASVLRHRASNIRTAVEAGKLGPWNIVYAGDLNRVAASLEAAMEAHILDAAATEAMEAAIGDWSRSPESEV